MTSSPLPQVECVREHAEDPGLSRERWLPLLNRAEVPETPLADLGHNIRLVAVPEWRFGDLWYRSVDSADIMCGDRCVVSKDGNGDMICHTRDTQGESSREIRFRIERFAVVWDDPLLLRSEPPCLAFTWMFPHMPLIVDLPTTASGVSIGMNDVIDLAVYLHDGEEMFSTSDAGKRRLQVVAALISDVCEEFGHDQQARIRVQLEHRDDCVILSPSPILTVLCDAIHLRALCERPLRDGLPVCHHHALNLDSMITGQQRYGEIPSLQEMISGCSTCISIDMA